MSSFPAMESIPDLILDKYRQIRDIPAVHDVGQALTVNEDAVLLLFAVAIFFGFFLIYAVAQLAFGGSKADAVLLTGLSGAGKTSLFFQLRDGTLHSGTVTSMEANQGRFPLHSDLSKDPSKASPVHIIDLPGHPRLRALVDKQLKNAKGVIFIVDALNFMPNIRSNSEFLFAILRHPEVVRRRIPILLACNKMDKVTAHSVDFVRKQLEKEIDKLRPSKVITSADGEESAIFIGLKDEPFKFAHCANKVSSVPCSAIDGGVGEIVSFIKQIS